MEMQTNTFRRKYMDFPKKKKDAVCEKFGQIMENRQSIKKNRNSNYGYFVVSLYDSAENV